MWYFFFSVFLLPIFYVFFVTVHWIDISNLCVPSKRKLLGIMFGGSVDDGVRWWRVCCRVAFAAVAAAILLLLCKCGSLHILSDTDTTIFIDTVTNKIIIMGEYYRFFFSRAYCGCIVHGKLEWHHRSRPLRRTINDNFVHLSSGSVALWLWLRMYELANSKMHRLRVNAMQPNGIWSFGFTCASYNSDSCMWSRLHWGSSWPGVDVGRSIIIILIATYSIWIRIIEFCYCDHNSDLHLQNNAVVSLSV